MITYIDHDENPFHTTDAQRNRAMILEAVDYIDVQRRVEADLVIRYAGVIDVNP